MPRSHKDPSILTPKKSIKEYCLFRCQKNGKTVGSKKDVLGCLDIHCPLYHYRTGILKSDKNRISKREKSSKLYHLERARREAESARKKVASISNKIEEEKRRNRERYFEDENDAKNRMKNRDLQIKETYGRKLEDAKSMLDKNESVVKSLEASYEEQLLAGLWESTEPEETE